MSSAYAQYACDHCNIKKLRCSKELPTCSLCRAWNNDCVYSRQWTPRQEPRKKKTKGTSEPNSGEANANAPAVGFEARLSSVETSITSLVSKIETLLESNKRSNGEIDAPQGDVRNPCNSTRSSSAEPALASIQDVLTGLEQVRHSSEGLNARLEEAWGALPILRSGSSAIESENKTWRAEVFRRRGPQVFQALDREEGPQMIDIFMKSMMAGRPMVTMPSQSLAEQMAYSPDSVTARGWLLMFYCILSTALSVMRSPNDSLRQKIAHNMWAAMDDSSIFLEPSRLNMEALLVVAAHGQEICTPSLCWSLVSHACRMMHILAFRSMRSNQDMSQKDLFLFWSLNVMDKSLAVIFGAPPTLPSYIFDKLPLPNDETLSMYNPATPDMGENELPTPLSIQLGNFGPLYVRNFFKLSKILDSVWHLLYASDRKDGCVSSQLEQCLDSLRSWYSNAMTELNSSPEMKYQYTNASEYLLGIAHVDFQYNTLLILLTKPIESMKEKCLQASRGVIEILPCLLSHSQSAHNGISWCRLHSSFIPFFTIFGNLIADPLASTTNSDTEHLKSVIKYFEEMRRYYKGAEELAHVARTFQRLAELHISYKVKELQDSTSRIPGIQDKSIDEASCTSPAGSRWVPQPLNLPRVSAPEEILSDEQFMSDILAYDPSTLINFFDDGSQQHLQPAFANLPQFNNSSNTVLSTHGWQTGLGSQATESANHDPPNHASTMEELMGLMQAKAGKRPIECTFDWFSWDAYAQAQLHQK